MQGLFIPALVFIVPLHPSVIGLFVLHQIVRNVLGHSGFEIFPRGTARHPVGRFITTHTHHDLHHSKVTGNYSLYFTWWDRWMGTLRDDYADTFDAVTTRPRTRASGGSSNKTNGRAGTTSPWQPQPPHRSLRGRCPPLSGAPSPDRGGIRLTAIPAPPLWGGADAYCTTDAVWPNRILRASSSIGLAPSGLTFCVHS